MDLFARFKISHKLLFLLLAVTVVLIVNFCMAVSKMNVLSGCLNQLADGKSGLISLVDSSRHLEAIFKELRISAIKYPMTVSQEERDGQRRAFTANKKNFLSVLERVTDQCQSQKECLDSVSYMKNQLDEYEKAAYDEVMRLTELNQNRDAYLAIQKYLVPIGANIDSRVEFLIKLSEERSRSIQKTVEHETKLITFIAVSTVGILLCIFITRMISNSIMSPINRLSQETGAIAGGDLSIAISHDDEIGNSLKGMLGSLRNVVSGLGEDAGRLRLDFENLARSNSNVASSSEKILSQSMTVASASEEMADTSRQIAKSCSEASEYSAEVQRIVREGGEKVRLTVEKIREHTEQTNESAKMIDLLGCQAQKISGIVGTIQDIADQTNLLALNAAIEAARAGEHGRGFAVVADEVRTLAGKTSGSTREISSMIADIQKMVGNATSTMAINVKNMNEIAEHTVALEESLNSINTSVETVHGQLIQIASATEEQTATSLEISSNMQSISDSTSSTAAETKTALGISEEIRQVTDSLDEKVKLFRL